MQTGQNCHSGFIRIPQVGQLAFNGSPHAGHRTYFPSVFSPQLGHLPGAGSLAMRYPPSPIKFMTSTSTPQAAGLIPRQPASSATHEGSRTQYAAKNMIAQTPISVARSLSNLPNKT